MEKAYNQIFREACLRKYDKLTEYLKENEEHMQRNPRRRNFIQKCAEGFYAKANIFATIIYGAK